MLRRTFLVAASAMGLAACGVGESSPSSVRASAAGFEVLLIDGQTPFGKVGKPYLNGLAEAGFFERAAAVEGVTLPDYGREDGALVRGSMIAVADGRAMLESFFGALPADWQLPASHAVRLGRGSWPEGTPERWGARVVRTSPALGPADVARVEVNGDGVDIGLTDRGREVFAEMSGANIGQRAAIVVDGEVVADPVFNERIPGGLVRITLEQGGDAHERLARQLDRALG